MSIKTASLIALLGVIAGFAGHLLWFASIYSSDGCFPGQYNEDSKLIAILIKAIIYAGLIPFFYKQFKKS